MYITYQAKTKISYVLIFNYIGTPGKQLHIYKIKTSIECTSKENFDKALVDSVNGFLCHHIEEQRIKAIIQENGNINFQSKKYSSFSACYILIYI